MFLSSLARLMRDDRPLVGVQAIGLDDRDDPDPTIEAMAARYVEALTASHAGPHLLGGFSGGGVIALEMSRRLQALGHEVRGVIVFDGVPPGAIELPRWSSRVNVLKNIVRSGLGPTGPYLRHRLGWRVQHLLDPKLAPPSEPLPPVFSEQLEQGLVDLSDHFARVSLRYDVPVYDVDVVVIKADLMWPYQPPDYHWSDYVGGSLRVLTTPGDHESMFRAPDVEPLWARVRPILENWDPRTRS